MDSHSVGKNRRGEGKQSTLAKPGSVDENVGLTESDAKKNARSSSASTQTERQKNNRLNDRYNLELDTEVHFQEQLLDGMFRCRTSNIGLHGVYLPAKDLPINDKTKIDLVFLARTRPEPQQFRVPAKLVRLEKEGAALSFSPKNEEQTQDFRRFLTRAKVAEDKHG